MCFLLDLGINQTPHPPPPTHPPTHPKDESEKETPNKPARSPPPRASAPPTTRKSGKLEPLQFMQEKQSMKKMVSQALASGEGSRSARGRLAWYLKKVDPSDVATMDENPNKTMSNLQSLDNDLRESLGQLDKVRAGDWPIFHAKLQDMTDRVKDERIASEALLAALDFMSKQATKVKKSGDNSVRYRRDRWAERLQVAGFPDEFSRRLSRRPEIENRLQAPGIATNPTNADLYRPVLWTSEGGTPNDEGQAARANDIGKDFMNKLLGITGAMKCIADKQENLQKFLSDSAHGGTMSRLDASSQRLNSLQPFAQAELLTEAGAAPWLNVTRPWTWRWGASVFPLPGMGGLILPLASCHVEFKFLLVPASVILTTGVPLQDLHTFWDTPSGLDVAAKHLHIVTVTEASSLWVPYGYICLPLICLTPEKADELGKKTDPTIFGNYIVFNPTLPDMARALDSGVWAALQSMNETHLNKVSEKKAWRDRAQYFSKICEVVATST